MFSTPSKIKVFVCNMIICVLSILSIVSYFFLPFWKVEATYTLRAETLQTMLPSPEDGGTDPANPEQQSGELEDTTPEDLYANIDLTEIVPEEGITIPLAIELQTSDILSSLSSDATELVDTIIQKNVAVILEKLEGTIDQLAEKAAETAVQMTFKTELKNQIKEQMSEDATDEEVQQQLNELGLTDEHIDAQTEKLVDALFAENASVDSVTNATVDIIKESLSEASSKGVEGYEDLELSPEAEEELKEQLNEAFSNFADEDGNINPTDAIMDMLVGMLKESEEPSDGGDQPEMTSSVKPNRNIVLLADSSEEEKQDAKEELRQLITDKLMSVLGESTEIIAMVIQYISYLILFTFFTWAYLILKILAKMFMKNPAIKLGLPIWLGSIPYVDLSLVPSLALSTLKNPPAQLADMMGDALENMSVLNDLSINFFSCACVSFYIGIALAIFVIVYYGRLRKRLKKIAKGQITEDAYVRPERTPKEKPVKKPVAKKSSSTPAPKPAEPIKDSEDDLFVPIKTEPDPILEEETPVSIAEEEPVVSTEALDNELNDDEE